MMKTAKKIANKYNITGFPVVDKANKVLGTQLIEIFGFWKIICKVGDIMTKENLAMVKEPINKKTKDIGKRRMKNF